MEQVTSFRLAAANIVGSVDDCAEGSDDLGSDRQGEEGSSQGEQQGGDFGHGGNGDQTFYN